MDIKDSIRKAMYDLPDTEKLIVLSVMIDTLMDRMDEMKKEILFIRSIPISKIDVFPDNPFYVDDDEDMKDLVVSVKNYGILTPAAVRIKDNGRYELLSGHRRLRACQLAGLDSMSCEVLTLTDEEAAVFMIETNRQRPKLRPIEKGLVYKFRNETITEDMDRDARMIRLDAEDTVKKIQKLIHLENLIPEFRDMVDHGKLSQSQAYEISYLPAKQQKVLWDCIECEQCYPTHAQAIRMKKLNDEGALTPELIEQIVSEPKHNQKDRLVLSEETLAHIPAGIPVSKREEYVAKALELIRKIRR